jgi:hypothetical protein
LLLIFTYLRYTYIATTIITISTITATETETAITVTAFSSVLSLGTNSAQPGPKTKQQLKVMFEIPKQISPL